MKLEDQVCSLELAKRLNELGVKQESVLFWCKYKDGHYNVVLSGRYDNWANDIGPNDYAAFTAAELGEMLPEEFWSGKVVGGGFRCSSGFEGAYESGPTEADARAKMLIYLVEQGVVKP